MAIVPPRVYAETGIPRGFARGDVLRLLATTEGDRPSDIRDRAMLMLFIAYGLRSGEVAGLRLDDVDWLEETLRVPLPEAREPRVSFRSRPLPDTRSCAIFARSVPDILTGPCSSPSRPRSRRSTVVLAPVSSGVAQTASAYGHRVRGAHALRHAAAQHLLDQGMSMKVIGDYLGHRSPSTTAIYARIDLKALREVADCDPGDLS